MPARYIHHVTLGTGDVRRSPRSDVADGVVAALRPLLDRALAGEHAPVPGQPGYTMTGGVHGRCCMVTVWRVVPDTVGPERVPVLSVGVGAHSRCGAYLWRAMHERADLTYATDPARCPPEPWCADRLDVGAAVYREALGWTGDLARCIAWAWIEMREVK